MMRAQAVRGGVLAGLAVAVVLVAAALSRPPRAAVLTDTTVVAELRMAGTAPSPTVQAHIRKARAAPGDPVLARTAARALIDAGRAAGDQRLVGAAIGILRPHLHMPHAETLWLAATARQYQHDFSGALGLLDRALAADPRHTNALLTRATLHIVQGRFDAARSDCDRIRDLPRADLGFLCEVTARLLTADAPGIGDRLAAIVAQPGLLDPALHPWAIGLMGEIAALQGNPAIAERHFAAVLAADPHALRERLLLADLLLDAGRGAEVLALMDPAPAVDGVLIRRVEAARMTGDRRKADVAAAELDRRFHLNIDLGLTAHAREEARYFLRIAQDAPLALARAQVNWDLQHEIEDARLLIDAAVAAGQPAAAAPVLRWMADAAVVVPVLRIPDAVRQAAR